MEITKEARKINETIYVSIPVGITEQKNIEEGDWITFEIVKVEKKEKMI